MAIKIDLSPPTVLVLVVMCFHGVDYLFCVHPRYVFIYLITFG